MEAVNKKNKYFLMGCFVAILWVLSAAPDLLETFRGNRAGNDVSFSPAWLKGVRDVCTLVLFIYIAPHSGKIAALFRLVALTVSAAYISLAISRGIAIPVAIRGVVWVPVIVWMSTATRRDMRKIPEILIGIFYVIIPVSIFVSILLGLFGVGMYYEGFLFYQRNPGLFLTPSATAFMACAFYVLLPNKIFKNGKSSFFAGILTLSGVFYINVILFFGRLPRVFYGILFAAFFIFIGIVGFDVLVGYIGYVAGNLRSDDAISVTLGTRLLIFSNAIGNISLEGNYPIGLNVAANQDLENFFPDNAVLAAVYAFGLIGGISAVSFLWAAYRIKNFGVFLLIFSTSLFYVWFENILFAAFAGIMINSDYWVVLRNLRR